MTAQYDTWRVAPNDISGDAPSGCPSYSGADDLNCDHQRIGQQRLAARGGRDDCACRDHSSVVERIKWSLVGLKMPRALEILDVTLRGIKRGETISCLWPCATVFQKQDKTKALRRRQLELWPQAEQFGFSYRFLLSDDKRLGHGVPPPHRRRFRRDDCRNDARCSVRALGGAYGCRQGGRPVNRLKAECFG
jgi:hypothetical protein